jgi:hypothetical protein
MMILFAGYFAPLGGGQAGKEGGAAGPEAFQNMWHHLYIKTISKIQ